MKDDAHEELARAVHGLTHALTDILAEHRVQFSWMVAHHHFATKQDLENQTHIIMSAISDFATKQNAFNDRLDAAVTGLQGDITTLNDKITALQNSQGQITPEDQALLDQIEQRASSIADKLDALDAMTPPAPPITSGSSVA